MTKPPALAEGATAPSLDQYLAAEAERRSLKGAYSTEELMTRSLSLIGEIQASDAMASLRALFDLYPDDETAKALIARVVNAGGQVQQALAVRLRQLAKPLAE